MQQIHFVSGLPRSGSTLFQQILGQNQNFHPTPTDGFINFWMNSKRNWKDNNEFRAMGMENVEPRVTSAMRGMFEGFFREELDSEKTIFVKSRGYMAYIEYLKDVFQNPDLKVIVLVRDVRAIVSSFEKLYRKRSISYPEFSNEDFVLSQSVEGRSDILLRDNGVVGLPILRLRDALRRAPDNLLVVRYQDLLQDPKTTFERVHDILKLPKFEYDFLNIKQVTNELDVYHGYKGLHDIKEGKITPPEGIPWNGILTEQYSNNLNNAFGDINQLANG